MQMTRPSVTWSPGVSLRPKASAVLGLEPERAGLAGCKLLGLFMHGAFFRTSQR